MAEGQNECKMTPLDEIWRHEAGAYLQLSLFTKTFQRWVLILYIKKMDLTCMCPKDLFDVKMFARLKLNPFLNFALLC